MPTWQAASNTDQATLPNRDRAATWVRSPDFDRFIPETTPTSVR